MATHSERASLLTLPTELRNAIYEYLFAPDPATYHPRLSFSSPGEREIIQKLRVPPEPPSSKPLSSKLDLLRTCKKIHDEAQYFALSMTPFHIANDCTYPDLFDLRSRALSPAKIGAIRYMTLTARTNHLRAMNEAWLGQPFGHPSLRLNTLVIFPKRPVVHAAALEEIADLSQSHTLAYIFSETLKGLRNVNCVELRNEGCFNEVVWRLFYRSLVYRLWRWGGGKCGMHFETGELQPGGTERSENQWFRVYLSGGEHEGVECGEEVVRLVGVTGELPDPNLAGVGP